jgi:CheY-like chemotaxis protein
MPLRLEYSDKYRLWSDLVRSHGDRMFVATTEAVKLGTTTMIEIQVPELAMPILVEGKVVGSRGKSRRFEAGVFVRIPEYELEKCRRFLGLRRPVDADGRARRALRVYKTLEVRFGEPRIETPCSTRNISETGLFVVGTFDLVVGQQVSIELMVGGVALPMEALVAWSAPAQSAAGLELIDLSEEVAGALRELIDSTIDEMRRDKEPRSRPIVVADDEPSILMLLSRTLAKHGYDVYQATDGDQAIELVRRLQPSLVILDVLLPNVDGAHVCKTMRADAEMASIPVILVSALDPQSLYSVAFESGATDYLCKPLHLGELLDLVGAYLAD